MPGKRLPGGGSGPCAGIAVPDRDRAQRRHRADGLSPASGPLAAGDPRGRRPAAAPTARCSGPSRCWSAAARPSCATIAERHGLTDWTTDLDAALARADVQIYFDAQVTSEREKAIRPGDRRPASTSTPRSRPPTTWPARSSWPGWPTPPASSTAWCRTSSSCPACASSTGWSRAASSAGSCRCAASSATGSSRATGRRRSGRRWNYRAADGGGIVVDMFPHWHYVLEQIFGPVRAVTAHVDHPHPAALGRGRRALRGDRRRRRVRHLRARRRRSSPRSTPPGRSGSTATSWSSSRSTAPRAARSPGCATAGSSTGPTTPKPVWNPDLPATERVPRRSGRRCRTTRSSTTASRRSGSCSCGTWPRTRRTPGTSGPAPAACSSPSWACGRPARAAASRSRSCDAVSRRRRSARRPAHASGAGAEFGHARRAVHQPGRVRRRARRRRSAAPRTSRAPRRRSTGTPPWPSAATSGRTASAWPRRWTPPSAAWAWTIRPTRELIRRAARRGAAAGGRIVAGVATDQLPPGPATLDEIRKAYAEQLADVQEAGAGPVLMCSRHLAAAARRGRATTSTSTASCSTRPTQPVMLHWLGPAFDPPLAGYWGADDRTGPPTRSPS